MILKSKELKLKGVKLFKIKKYTDSRGHFKETYLLNSKLNEFNLNYVQENESTSKKNVFRGMHFQKGRYSQSKLLRVICGSILDVMFDLREKSPSFNKKLTIKLVPDEILFIPKGIAHGFLSLENNTTINYKCDQYYKPNFEFGFNPFKSNLNINWPINTKDIILSSRDKNFPSLKELKID
tara:strand:+ start:2503 stop:3045 length:543 start_codon:yes stop_codon:yes gene_type:complete